MFRNRILLLGAAFSLGNVALAADPWASISEPVGVDVSWCPANEDYEGIDVGVNFQGTASQNWLVHMAKYDPDVTRMYCNYVYMQSTTYVAETTNGSRPAL